MNATTESPKVATNIVAVLEKVAKENAKNTKKAVKIEIYNGKELIVTDENFEIDKFNGKINQFAKCVNQLTWCNTGKCTLVIDGQKIEFEAGKFGVNVKLLRTQIAKLFLTFNIQKSKDSEFVKSIYNDVDTFLNKGNTDLLTAFSIVSLIESYRTNDLKNVVRQLQKTAVKNQMLISDTLKID